MFSTPHPATRKLLTDAEAIGEQVSHRLDEWTLQARTICAKRSIAAAWSTTQQDAKLERERLELFNAANAWQRAADLRAFVDAVRAANRTISAPAAERLERWAADALSAADRLDPLKA